MSAADVFPSPPPWMVDGFITTPRTVGRIPIQRCVPPSYGDILMIMLPTCLMVA
jgi:hypothetical protein